MRASPRHQRLNGFGARAKRLPAEQQGPLILVLLGNAVPTIALQTSWLVLVGRALRQVMPQRDYRRSRTLPAERSPVLAVVTGIVLVQRLSHPLFTRALDRWVTDKSQPFGPQPDSPGDR